jgi:bifunctional non-homologous end joining protein LigD
MAGPGRLPPILPMLATPARQLPADDDAWSAEIKWDGVRALAFVSAGEAVLRGRDGKDVSGSYPELVAALAAAAGRRSLILDGEVIAFDCGRPSFSRLQKRMHVARPTRVLTSSVPVSYVAFDLLHQAGRSLLRNPYAQRRALLDALDMETGIVSVPPAFPGEARAVIDASKQLGLEGVMLKRLRSYYYPGRRTGSWLKVKHLLAADVVIGGWLPGTGARQSLAGSVIVGQPGSAGLEYLGQVGSGFTIGELRELTSRLRQLEQPGSPFAGPLPQAVTRRAHWVRPVLNAEVTYGELTPAGRLRHPVWRGLRPA